MRRSAFLPCLFNMMFWPKRNVASGPWDKTSDAVSRNKLVLPINCFWYFVAMSKSWVSWGWKNIYQCAFSELYLFYKQYHCMKGKRSLQGVEFSCLRSHCQFNKKFWFHTHKSKFPAATPNSYILTNKLLCFCETSSKLQPLLRVWCKCQTLIISRGEWLVVSDRKNRIS